MDTHTLVLDVRINQFRSIGGVFPIGSEFIPMGDVEKIFSVNEKDIKIYTKCLPPPEAIQIVFQFADSRYLPIGIAFSNANGAFSEGQFDEIKIEKSSLELPHEGHLSSGTVISTHSLTAIDSKIPTSGSIVSYDYIIFIQDTLTGEIGLIDPDIEADPTDTPP